MMIKLEHKDIEAIARQVAEELRGTLNSTGTPAQDDQIFDVNGLVEYLKVKETWVYERTSNNTIPFIKKGR